MVKEYSCSIVPFWSLSLPVLKEIFSNSRHDSEFVVLFCQTKGRWQPQVEKYEKLYLGNKILIKEIKLFNFHSIKIDTVGNTAKIRGFD